MEDDQAVSMESDTTIEMEDKKDELTELSYSEMSQHVMNRFEEAENARRPIEIRMARAWTNFRGIKSEDTRFTKTEKSQAFIKLTKTKVVAGVGQVYDIVSSGGKLPISVKATPRPEGIPDKAHVDMESINGGGGEEPQVKTEVDFGFEGDGKGLEPGASLASRIKEIVLPIFGAMPFTEGPALNGEFEIDPSQLAANEMMKEISDQLAESHAVEEFSKAIYEGGLLGSGCIKGPFTETKEYPNWDTKEDGTRIYNPTIKKVPVCEQVSIWAVYPDPNAKSVQDAEYVIQRHRMTDYQLRSIGAKKHFRSTVIDEIIDMEVRPDKTQWEHTVQEADNLTDNRHVVYEYWGNVETEEFGKEFEKELPEDIKKQKNMQVNIWVCQNKIIRMAINPFLPKRIPYQIFHWEKDLYNFFGVGIAENMEDSQMLVNGFWRLAIDNAALAGNMVFEADEMNLVPGQDLTVYPGKVFRRRAGAPGQALFSHKFNSTAFENIQVMEKAQALADTSTGIPAVSHGQPAGTVGRTAMGMSMMMGAAGLNIKTVIRNLDENGFKPLGEAYFAWNMQFSEKTFLKGDLSIVATGTDNLLQKEVRSQRLMQFLQIGTANPITAPLVNAEYIITELAKTLELDVEEVINSPAKQAAVAAMMQAAQNQGGANGDNIPTGENGPMSAQDQTGGGGSQAGVGDPVGAQASAPV
jgi:hypothetical protein